MHALLAIAVLPVSAIGLAALNWIALRPWRRCQHQHWTEQSRRLWPVLVSARSAIWTMPLIAIVSLVLLRPDASLWLYFAAGVSGLVGAMAGALLLSRELFSWFGWRELFCQSAIGLCLQLLLWIALAPEAFRRLWRR